MNTFKTCKVVLLPVDISPVEGQICKWNIDHPDRDKTIGTFTHFGIKDTKVVIAQHLYIINKEHIVENDYIYNEDQKSIVFVDCKANAELANATNYRWKIITSTNSLLNLPQIPQSFINLYIEEYNKGNKIEKVEVEYELIKSPFEDEDNPADITFEREILKVDSDNTISIRPIKESWNRREVEQLLRTFDIQKGRDITSKEFDKWIKNNL